MSWAEDAEPTDSEAMVRLADGEVHALGVLHRRHARTVMAVVRGVDSSLSPEEAEDLCQEVWLTLHRTAGRYQDAGNLKAWVCGIAVKKVRGNRRRLWARRAVHRRHGVPTAGIARPGGTETEERLASRQSLERALGGLSPGQREVLVLHVVEGLSGAEVAQALGISEGAVWTRIHRSRKAALETLRRET
jgi:RNA polymerase sigma-70 factor (ECF subfamily)